MRQAGWKLFLALDAYATHLHSASFARLGINRQQLHQEAISTFNSRRAS